MKRKKLFGLIVLTFVIMSGFSLMLKNENHADNKSYEEYPPSYKTEDVVIDEIDVINPEGVNNKEQSLLDVSLEQEIDNNTGDNLSYVVERYCSIHGDVYDGNCEECPPPRLTEGIEIDGRGGINPDWINKINQCP